MFVLLLYNRDSIWNHIQHHYTWSASQPGLVQSDCNDHKEQRRIMMPRMETEEGYTAATRASILPSKSFLTNQVITGQVFKNYYI